LDGSHRYFAKLQRGLGTLRGDISIRDVDLDDCQLDIFEVKVGTGVIGRDLSGSAA